MNQPINPSPYNEVVDATAPDGVTLSCEIPNTDDTIDSTVFVLYNETDKTAVSFMEDKSKREINDAGNLCVSVSVNTTEIENGKDYSWRAIGSYTPLGLDKIPVNYKKHDVLTGKKSQEILCTKNSSNFDHIFSYSTTFEWEEGIDSKTRGFLNWNSSNTSFTNTEIAKGAYVVFESRWNRFISNNPWESYCAGTVVSKDNNSCVLELELDYIESSYTSGKDVFSNGWSRELRIIVYEKKETSIIAGEYICIPYDDNKILTSQIKNIDYSQENIEIYLTYPLPLNIYEKLGDTTDYWICSENIDYGESPYYYFSTAKTPEFYVRNVGDNTDTSVYYNANLNNIFDVTIEDKTIMQSLKYNIYIKSAVTNRTNLIASSPVIYNKNETHWCYHGLKKDDEYIIEAVLTTKDGQKIVSSKSLLPYYHIGIESGAAFKPVTATFLSSKDGVNTRCIEISGFDVLNDSILLLSAKILDIAKENGEEKMSYNFNIDILREDLTDEEIEYAGMLECAVDFKFINETITMSTGLNFRKFYDYNIKCGHKYKYYAQPSFFNAKRYIITSEGFTSAISSSGKDGDIWISTTVTNPHDEFCYFIKNGNMIKIPSLYILQYRPDGDNINGINFYTMSNEVTPSWDSWCISSLIQDDNVDNKFYVDLSFSWNMPLNFEPSAIQYNNGKAYTERFSKYPLINKGYSGYLQGSIKFLYGDEEILCKTGEYSNPSIVREKWIEFIDSSDYKLLSDTHGHNMIVDISNLRFEYDETVIGSPMYISFDYIQVTDTENVIITGV